MPRWGGMPHLGMGHNEQNTVEMSNRHALEPGTMLRQYRIDSVVGQGGFGITYLAFDTDLQRRVAIKECYPRDFVSREGTTVVPTGASQTKDFHWALGKFVDEATTLARFKHPGIVQVLQIIKDENESAYMVLEFVEGQSFDQWLKSKTGPPDEDSLKTVIAPLLDALEVVHENNIAHRDIAPDNIYIREDGSAVLLDFGAAKQTLVQQSRTLNLVVKDGYSAPEQYYAEGRQGPWTDVYAFAATLYRAIAGKRPVDAMARLDALNNDEPDPLEPLSKLAPSGYTSGFLSAISDGMAPQTKARPQSVKAWRDSILGTGPASPATGTAPTDAAFDKTRVQRFDPSNSGDSKDTAKKKSRSAATIFAGLVLVCAAGVGAYLFFQYSAAQAEKRAWDDAASEDTVAAYQGFISNHPSSELMSSAQLAIRALNSPWTKVIDLAASERANDVAITSKAIVIAGGTVASGSTEMKGLVQSVSLSGRQNWRASYGGAGSHVFEGIHVAPDGDFVAVGNTRVSSSAGPKGLVAKYDANGEEKWTKLVGDSGDNGLMDAVVKPDGSVVAVGWAKSPSGSGTDGWVATFNPFGDLMNAQFLGGPGNDRFDSVALMPDGTLAMVGQQQREGAQDANFWLVKLAADGNVILDRAPGGRNTDSFGGVAATRDGQLVVVGQTDSFGSNTFDGMIMRVTADNKTPPKVLAEARDDYLTGVALSADDSVVVAGYTSSRGAGQTDGWVIKYNKNLDTVQWERVLGGKGWDTIENVAVLPDGSTILVGGKGKEGSGGSDLWIIRLGPDGQYDGS